jgi:tetratricopeptide (TPR) repeat protein
MSAGAWISSTMRSLMVEHFGCSPSSINGVAGVRSWAQSMSGRAVAEALDRAIAKHGDFAGAEAKLKDANQRGPHWADPLKAWGDILAKQGHAKKALAKYDEALEYAPNWKQLKEARKQLAKQKT